MGPSPPPALTPGPFAIYDPQFSIACRIRQGGGREPAFERRSLAVPRAKRMVTAACTAAWLMHIARALAGNEAQYFTLLRRHLRPRIAGSPVTSRQRGAGMRQRRPLEGRSHSHPSHTSAYPGVNAAADIFDLTRAVVQAPLLDGQRITVPLPQRRGERVVAKDTPSSTASASNDATRTVRISMESRV